MPITKVVMPKLSEAMESGKVIKWIKKEGDRGGGGEIIAEIETDKADLELEAFGSGVLRKIVVPAGDRAPVGGLIAVIADAADDIAGLLAGRPPPPRRLPYRWVSPAAGSRPRPWRRRSPPGRASISGSFREAVRADASSGGTSRPSRRRRPLWRRWRSPRLPGARLTPSRGPPS